MCAVEKRPSRRCCSSQSGRTASAYPDSSGDPKRTALYQKKNRIDGRTPSASSIQRAHGQRRGSQRSSPARSSA
jgi:hypothetical protein